MSPFVYIVDDDADVRESLRALLGLRQAYLLVPFASGDAFLTGIMEREPGVALLDLHMPGQSGLDVLARLKDYGTAHEVVAMTGQSDVGKAVAAMKLGAADFLEKPFDHATLFAAVDSAFEQLAARAGHAGRRADARRRMDRLSEREQEVFDALCEGHSHKEVAGLLAVTPRTVEFHRANIMDKLGVGSLPEAIRVRFLALGWPVDSHRPRNHRMLTEQG